MKNNNYLSSMENINLTEEDKERLQPFIDNFENNVKIVLDKVNEYFKNLSKVFRKISEDYKPFFEKYGYDIKYMNTIIYKAKYAKKKRVRNKYRNMLKNTLGQEFVNSLIKNDNI